MSYLFDANSEYLYKAAPGPAIPPVYTMCVWVYPLNAYNDNLDHTYVAWVLTDINDFHIGKTTANTVVFGRYPVGEGYRVLGDASGFTANAWHLLLGHCNPITGLVVYVDGVQIGTANFRAEAETTLATHNFYVGAYPVWGNSANARIAHLTCWNRILGVNERSCLLTGILPSQISKGLVWYYPITGRDNPEVDLVGMGYRNTIS
jgi:hypothetical protein